jgi:hypothetical protein
MLYKTSLNFLKKCEKFRSFSTLLLHTIHWNYFDYEKVESLFTLLLRNIPQNHIDYE